MRLKERYGYGISSIGFYLSKVKDIVMGGLFCHTVSGDLMIWFVGLSFSLVSSFYVVS